MIEVVWAAGQLHQTFYQLSINGTANTAIAQFKNILVFLNYKFLVKEINPYADSLLASHGKVDTKGLLSITAYDEHNVSRQQETIGHDHHHHHHHHITSYSFTFDQDFDFQKFYQWATVLLTFQSGRIYRIKGVISFNGHEEKMIFQSVKSRFLLTAAEKWEVEGKRNSRIVFIGKELRRDILEKHLKQCLKRIE